MNEFGRKRIVRGKDGKEELKDSPGVWVTRHGLGKHHGIDRDRKLVVMLCDGDLIKIKPYGTTRAKAVSVFDIYDYAVRCEARLMALERARMVKERKAERRAAERQARAEKKFRSEVRAEQTVARILSCDREVVG